MSGSKTRCDATPIQREVPVDDKRQAKSENVKKPKKSGEFDEKVFEKSMNEVMEEVNKATAFLDSEAFRNLTSGTPANQTFRAQVPGRTGTSRNEFNIIGGTIGQAAIGNTGNVVFNQKQQIYEKGAVKTNFDISGGNFAQANIGGEATYNNQDTKLAAGGGGKMYFTPEELTLHILERGVSTKQLAMLLERQYTLANIAFAMPKDPALRDNMVRALLVDQEMEVN